MLAVRGYEEQGNFPKEISACQLGINDTTIGGKDFDRPMPDEVHLMTHLSRPEDIVARRKDDGAECE